MDVLRFADVIVSYFEKYWWMVLGIGIIVGVIYLVKVIF